jgi:CRP/FNR family transcriptional regulator, cyclic AMP receptor protein
MELIGRMLEGSIPYSPKDALPRRGGPGLRLRQEDKISHLGHLPLLAGCTRKQLRAVARIAEVREMPAGTVLTRTGEPGDEFFLILDGRVGVEVSSRKRGKLGPGEVFGEMSLLDGGPRSATVTAETPVRLLILRRRDFDVLLSKLPDLPRHLLVVLSRRLRQAEQALNA